MKIYAFIQARMSSSRYPGKVLAPICGRPLIERVIKQVSSAVDVQNVIVLTSVEHSDDPLVSYLNKMNIRVFRGSLNNVFERFQDCLKLYPCDYFFRVCGDSPFLSGELLQKAMSVAITCDEKPDLVTNVFPKTFPAGMSVELLKSSSFSGIDKNGLSDEENEHITRKYYNNPSLFKIARILSAFPELKEITLAVDDLEDLKRMEKMGPAAYEKYTEKIQQLEVLYG